MDCFKAGGGCCASTSYGTGTVSVAEKTSEELCGYCFTGDPSASEATLEGTLHSVTHHTCMYSQKKNLAVWLSILDCIANIN